MKPGIAFPAAALLLVAVCEHPSAEPQLPQSSAAVYWEVAITDPAEGVAHVRGVIPPLFQSSNDGIELVFRDLPRRPGNLREIRASCTGHDVVVSAPFGDSDARRRIAGCQTGDSLTVEFDIEPTFFPPGDAGEIAANARSRITPELAILRTRTLLPELTGTDADLEVSFILPASWTAVTPWAGDSGRYRIPGPSRADVEYIGAGPFKVVEVSLDGTLVRVAVPYGQTGFATADIRAFLREATGVFGALPSDGPFSALIVPQAFMRGGAAGAHSVVQPPAPEVLAHEISHWWIHAGLSADDARWFTEGFVEYYGVEIARRSGLFPDVQAQACLADLAAEMRYLERDSAISLGSASLRSRSDAMASRLVYSKGALLAQHLQRGLEAEGRSLDELMREVVRGGSASMDSEAFGELFGQVFEGSLRSDLESAVLGNSRLPDLDMGEATGESGCARFLPGTLAPAGS